MINATETSTDTKADTKATDPHKARMTENDANAVRIVARSLVREFKSRGYGLRHIVTLANELIGLACETVRSNAKTAAET
jgi:hypothetical protein